MSKAVKDMTMDEVIKTMRKIGERVKVVEGGYVVSNKMFSVGSLGSPVSERDVRNYLHGAIKTAEAISAQAAKGGGCVNLGGIMDREEYDE